MGLPRWQEVAATGKKFHNIAKYFAIEKIQRGRGQQIMRGGETRIKGHKNSPLSPPPPQSSALTTSQASSSQFSPDVIYLDRVLRPVRKNLVLSEKD